MAFVGHIVALGKKSLLQRQKRTEVAVVAFWSTLQYSIFRYEGITKGHDFSFV